MENRAKSRGKSPPRGESDVEWVQQALAGLQLPRMPQAPFHPENPEQSSSSTNPTIRILLVSDIDLPSASALAEYTLLQNNQVFDASRIDLCIACGPFCRDEDLLPYLRGKQRKRLQDLLEDERKRNNKQQLNGGNRTSPAWSSVFFRSREETAALEGLVTAAISQLESIVCRVVFCPGNTDPLTTSTSAEDLRFTPNSRNIHRQWLPLAPGLGCAGLLFLDAPNGVLQMTPPRGRRLNQPLDYDSDEEVDGERYSDHNYSNRHGDRKTRGKGNTLRLTRVHGNDGMGSDNYLQTLERLIQNAPNPQPNYPFGTKLSQTILVTHYFRPPVEEREDDGSEDNNVYGQYRSSEDETYYDVMNGGDDRVANVSQDSGDDCSDDDNDNDNNNNQKGCDQVPKPWPPDHSNFVGSSLVQEHLALEIASGGGVSQRPKEVQKGNVRIVIPGSLRERGEFCLVDMSLVEQAVKKNMTTAASSPPAKKIKPTFAWRVGSVEFHNMERLP
ncbi:expressed unknown protein [Seminavis robusta]|uniref:Uncharacterized protein n=1 Tax=Seminavis robusta TaxID=568900 RepID=A0A9N8H2H9_9STRA|nr:expressed unknown protein [Seminavis robusta]|eukprot:Sro37_g023030.1 n/a (501) ;mRNA; f:16312-17916